MVESWECCGISSLYVTSLYSEESCKGQCTSFGQTNLIAWVIFGSLSIMVFFKLLGSLVPNADGCSPIPVHSARTSHQLQENLQHSMGTEAADTHAHTGTGSGA